MKIEEFNTLWINKDPNNNLIPDYIASGLKSYVIKNVKINLYVYKKYDNIPDGVTIKDANDIIPIENFFLREDSPIENKDKTGSIATFTDYFRIKMLLDDNINCWVDSDTFLIDNNFDKNDILAVAIQEHDRRVQNTFLYFNKKEKICQQIINYIRLFYDDLLKIQEFFNGSLLEQNKKIVNMLKTNPELVNSGKDLRAYFPWQYPGSSLWTSIFDYLDIKHLAYEYRKYFCPYLMYFGGSIIFEKDINELDLNLFKDIKVFHYSTDYLRRCSKIGINEKSYIGNLIKKVNDEYNKF